MLFCCGEETNAAFFFPFLACDWGMRWKEEGCKTILLDNIGRIFGRAFWMDRRKCCLMCESLLSLGMERQNLNGNIDILS